MTTVDVGNPTTNVVPNEARASFNIRFNDTWTPETLEAEIRRRLDAATEGWICYTATFAPTNAVAFVTEPGPFVGSIVKAVTGGDRGDAEAVHDRRHLRRPLHQGLLPGGRVRSRRPDDAPDRREHRRDELVALERVYRRIIADYFAA